MSRTFDLLRRRDSKVLDAYYEANRLWGEVLCNIEDNYFSPSLAQSLSSLQMRFEYQLKKYGFDRWEAQEVMVFSGLSFYLENNRRDRYKANLISEAFEMSYCSVEVKSLAKRASSLFYLGRERGYYYE